MKRLVCLDIHGVCCDFVSGFLQYHEINMSLADWPKGEYNIEKVTGKSLHDLPQEFWESLPETREFTQILQCLAGHVIFASSKYYNRATAMGTYAWYLSRFYKIPFVPVCMGWKAEYFNPHGIILIDDCEDEIRAWTGPTILVPRPWNNATGDPVETIRRRLEEIGDE